MESFYLTHKDLLELKHWLTCSLTLERAKAHIYLLHFGLSTPPKAPDAEELTDQAQVSILEVGVGPFWGLLPHIPANKKLAIDPLLRAYYALGILDPRGDIQFVNEQFEKWDTNEKFDKVLCANALDHGEMGFNLMPKLSNLLKPGGRLYIHVQLRKPDQLNLIHDHALNEEQLNRNLSFTDLKEIKREFLERDFDAPHCPALVGIWEKP